MVYLSNMYAYGAEKSVNQLYHLWFKDGSNWDTSLPSSPSAKGGPPPGYVPGGPNRKWQGEGDDDFKTNIAPTLVPPYNQPVQKAYRDWNGQAPKAYVEKPWSVTEPSIEYNCLYIWYLSKYATITSHAVPIPSKP